MDSAPELSPDELTACAETLRQMWQHEDNIANHRITWFTTTQGLLFAALALVVKEQAGSLKPVLVAVGVGSCLLTFASLLLGSHAKARLQKWWKKNEGNYAGPPVIGFYVKAGSLAGYLAPSNLLPLLFGGAWLYLARCGG